VKKLCAILIFASVALIGLQGQQNTGMIEWPYYGSQAAHTKYSLAADITPANVGRLAPAWEWKVGEVALPNGNRPGTFQAVPLMIDNVLYLSTSFNRVVALDAETGKELWAFDPQTSAERSGSTHRGVAYWRDGNDARIFMNSGHRLFSVDAKTGRLVTSFGTNGYAMMNEGLRSPYPALQMDQSSPAVIYNNLVIVGSSMSDTMVYKGNPPGTVQAFDAKTGKRVWVFYTVPSPGEVGNETWEKDSWAYTGHSNVWGMMSVDTQRGLLFAPTSTPSGDFWGGRRPGNNLFAESLVCLDANTGKMKWYFQGVHHGVWDYDFTSAPTLLTINVDGKRIDAVAQSGKQGFTYVFDRVTGQPVWPIEERPVPTDTDVPGEVLSPTQPFPTKPPAFVPQGVSLEDANDLTPEIHALAVEEMKQYRLGPLFTPPMLRGTLMRPSAGGGANWGSSGADPETGFLYLKVSMHTHVVQVCPRDEKYPLIGKGVVSDIEYNTNCPVNTAGRGPTGQPRDGRKLGAIPVVKPPWAAVVAIDLNKGDIVWRSTLGEGAAAVRRSPLLQGVKLPDRLGSHGNGGGLVITKGGVIFATMTDPYIYAFDKVTGREISRVATPGGINGAPMTYKSRAGRQFVVVANGGGEDATLSAFALPAQ
jgi:quinoprotein glucose dehydrogenase